MPKLPGSENDIGYSVSSLRTLPLNALFETKVKKPSGTRKNFLVPPVAIWWRRRVLPPASEGAPIGTSPSAALDLFVAAAGPPGQGPAATSPELISPSRPRQPGLASPHCYATTSPGRLETTERTAVLRPLTALVLLAKQRKQGSDGFRHFSRCHCLTRRGDLGSLSRPMQPPSKLIRPRFAKAGFRPADAIVAQTASVCTTGAALSSPNRPGPCPGRPAGSPARRHARRRRPAYRNCACPCTARARPSPGPPG